MFILFNVPETSVLMGNYQLFDNDGGYQNRKKLSQWFFAAQKILSF